MASHSEPQEAAKMSAQTEQTPEERWHRILVEGHPKMTWAHRIFRHLPSPPRCKVCFNPFGGIGGKIAGLAGFRPSRKNPRICAT